jgi:hypothetical protein
MWIFRRLDCTLVLVAAVLPLSSMTINAQAGDPPGRIGRLSYPTSSSTSISLLPAGEREWTRDFWNRPLTSGDKLSVGKGAKSEVQVGSTSIRMTSETDLTFVTLDDHTTLLKVDRGSVVVRVRHLDDDDSFVIQVPDFVCTVKQVGEYRVDTEGFLGIKPGGAATWTGKLEITADFFSKISGFSFSAAVVKGQRVRLELNSTSPLKAPKIEPVPPPDDFDKWAVHLDERDDKSESSNYVSPEMTGQQDLDDAGHWRYAANYGGVWTPTVAAGWVPIAPVTGFGSRPAHQDKNPTSTRATHAGNSQFSAMRQVRVPRCARPFSARTMTAASGSILAAFLASVWAASSSR